MGMCAVAGSHVEHIVRLGKGRQQIVDKQTIDLAVVHRVVFTRLLGRVHQFWFQHARQHGLSHLDPLVVVVE